MKVEDTCSALTQERAWERDLGFPSLGLADLGRNSSLSQKVLAEFASRRSGPAVEAPRSPFFCAR